MARFIQLTLLGTTQDQQMIMNFYYRYPGNNPDTQQARKLAEALGFIGTVTSVGERLAEAMSGASTFTSCIARDIVNPLDYVAEPSRITGNLDSLDLPPPFLAAKLTGNRQRADIRSTTHAIPLPSDGVTLTGGFLSADYRGRLQLLSDKMAAPVDTQDASGTTLTWLPVTIKKEKYTTPNGKKAYRLVRTEEYLEANYSIITSFRVAGSATTQNSRKRGRGA